MYQVVLCADLTAVVNYVAMYCYVPFNVFTSNGPSADLFTKSAVQVIWKPVKFNLELPRLLNRKKKPKFNEIHPSLFKMNLGNLPNLAKTKHLNLSSKCCLFRFMTFQNKIKILNLNCLYIYGNFNFERIWQIWREHFAN